jgi:hypothetical protein
LEIDRLKHGNRGGQFQARPISWPCGRRLVREAMGPRSLRKRWWKGHERTIDEIQPPVN